MPTQGRAALTTPERATFLRIDGDYAVYSVGSGDFTFRSLETSFEDFAESMDELVEQDRLAGHVAAGLRDRLDRAMQFARDGREEPAIGMLEQFIARASNQVMGDAQDVEVRNMLISYAEALIAALEEAEAEEDTA